MANKKWQNKNLNLVLILGHLIQLNNTAKIINCQAIHESYINVNVILYQDAIL